MTDAPLRVGVFVATRADLSPLVPVLAALQRADGIETVIATAIGFDAASLAAELERRQVDLPADEVGPLVDVTEPAELARVGAVVSGGVAEWLQRREIEVLLVLGDRWELLYAVPPALVLGVRLVHLHGGEITEGALDDRVRHALTKLADQHAVATVDAAAVVAQLGEPPQRIHRTGAPGLDLVAGAAVLDDEGWLAAIGRVPDRPVALVTVHSPTVADGETPDGLARDVLAAAREVCATAIVTHPGPDPGREQIIGVLETTAAGDPGIVLIASLGRRYPEVLRSVDVVVGNSSSGVIEAATAGVAAVDVGDRQAGRDRAASVLHARADRDEIAAAIRTALGSARPAPDTNPYGDGQAAPRIVEVVRSAAGVSRRKPFVRAGKIAP